MIEELNAWKIEQKKAAYELYIGQTIDEDDYHLRLKLIDEIQP